MVSFILVSCPSLSSPIGGSFNLSTDGLSTRATFACDSGFSLNGSANLHCLGDQTWDENVPSCR